MVSFDNMRKRMLKEAIRISETKADEEIEHEKRQKAIIDLAYRYLNIVDCQKCGLPKRKGFNCLHCGNENC